MFELGTRVDATEIICISIPSLYIIVLLTLLVKFAVRTIKGHLGIIDLPQSSFDCFPSYRFDKTCVTTCINRNSSMVLAPYVRYGIPIVTILKHLESIETGAQAQV